MSVRSLLMPALSQRCLSRDRLLKARVKAERLRRSKAEPQRVHYLHQVDDPNSALLATGCSRRPSKADLSTWPGRCRPPCGKAWVALPRIIGQSQRCPKPAHRKATAHQAEANRLRQRQRQQQRLGHHLGATRSYAGEWYWGIDRLHHLEQRLQNLGVQRPGVSGRLFAPDAGLGRPERPGQAIPGPPDGGLGACRAWGTSAAVWPQRSIFRRLFTP